MRAANFNHKYNDELSLVDSLFEFHPEYFHQLAQSHRSLLRRYYLYDRPNPKDIFEYRVGILNREPELETNAHEALTTLKEIAHIRAV